MTHDTDATRLSKFLSLVLRHRPDRIGLALDPQGWCAVDELIERSRKAGHDFDRQQLTALVAANDKQRFTLSADGSRIRAAQGHSMPVELGLTPQLPPMTLYHGTATRFLPAILREGLKPRSRRHVHLSADPAVAVQVGQRHGKPLVLAVAAGRMHAAGALFWCADNGVWLCDAVAPAYLTRLDEAGQPVG